MNGPYLFFSPHLVEHFFDSTTYRYTCAPLPPISPFRVREWGHDLVFHVHFPRFYINGTYELRGRLVMLQLDARGPAEVEVGGVRAQFRTLINETAAGRPHLYRMPTTIAYERMWIRVRRLFGDNEALGETVNAAINQNIDVFADEVMPLVRRRLSAIFQEHINQFFGHFMMKDLFP